mmetsp:Transcript_40381/g.106986  ORF Transcript_40381/g.106986 Transcript_40381/m.106986 type:complete len:214 (-) Transcript_40381:297-938(-)
MQEPICQWDRAETIEDLDSDDRVGDHQAADGKDKAIDAQHVLEEGSHDSVATRLHDLKGRNEDPGDKGVAPCPCADRRAHRCLEEPSGTKVGLVWIDERKVRSRDSIRFERGANGIGEAVDVPRDRAKATKGQWRLHARGVPNLHDAIKLGGQRTLLERDEETEEDALQLQVIHLDALVRRQLAPVRIHDVEHRRPFRIQAHVCEQVSRALRR